MTKKNYLSIISFFREFKYLIGKIRFTESKVTSDPDPFQSPDPDPPSRNRIRIKMKRIHNTGFLKTFQGQSSTIFNAGSGENKHRIQPLEKNGTGSSKPKVIGSNRIRILIPGYVSIQLFSHCTIFL